MLVESEMVPQGLLPWWEKVAEGRMRGGQGRMRWPYAGTLSPSGRRVSC